MTVPNVKLTLKNCKRRLSGEISPNLVSLVCSAQECENNEALFKQNYTPKLFIAFKMAYYWGFS